MNAFTYPAWCADCWVAMNIFRNLGFAAEDLFFGHVPVVGAGLCVVVALRLDGRQFTWTIARLDGDSSDIEATWERFATSMNEAKTDEELHAVEEASTVLKRTGFTYIGMWNALRAKGFRCPAFLEVDEKLDELNRKHQG